MHTAFNFDFMARPWDAKELRESIDTTLEAHAPVGAPATWVLSNHDVTRPVTRYGREDTSFDFAAKRFGTPTDLELGTRRARAAALLVAALPGALYVYQGDELGLPEVEDVPRDGIQDPMHFRSEGVDPGRDGCRVPLPVDPHAPPRLRARRRRRPGCPSRPPGRDWSVEAQDGDPDSMLASTATAPARSGAPTPSSATADSPWLDTERRRRARVHPRRRLRLRRQPRDGPRPAARRGPRCSWRAGPLDGGRLAGHRCLARVCRLTRHYRHRCDFPQVPSRAHTTKE